MSFKSTLIDDATIQAFRDAGFEDKDYPEQNVGIFLTKEMSAADYKGSKDDINNELVESSDRIVIEICPDSSIQTCYKFPADMEHSHYDYVKEKESWIQVARDAGVKI